MSRRMVLSLALTIALALSAFAGTRTIWGAQAAPAPVKTATARILVNAQGMTLYLFALDKHNKSVCTGACATYWPPALLPLGTTSAPATLSGVSGTFDVAIRGDGTRQLTYDGAPLYTFSRDRKPGDMAGQGAQGIWWAVVISAAQATTPASGQGPTTTPTASSYYGQGGDDRGHGGHGQGGSASPTPAPTSSYYGKGGDQ